MNGRLRGVIGFTALMVLVSTLLTCSAYAADKLKAGDSPPDKLGRDASGTKIRITDYRGKIVIVSFWASWCGPCRKELPLLAGIQKKATRDKLVVIFRELAGEL